MNISRFIIFAIIAICLLAFCTNSVASRHINKHGHKKNNHDNLIESLELSTAIDTDQTNKGSAVTCPDGSLCPDGNTCCSTGNGYACCPTPNAVCCSDHQHCCPYEFSCGNNGNLCKPAELRRMFSR